MTRLSMATMATLLLAMTLVGCSATAGQAPSASTKEPLVVFLVRHGEKVDLGEDPALSAAGSERAGTLASTLRSAQIEYVHSSDYVRTRETAAPTADEHGLEVELYDPRDLPAVAERLRRTGGRHLVVGHSNTTPSMVELLGGQAISSIDEKSEYDRLYIVTIGKDGVASSVLLRYGRPYRPGHN